MKTTRLLTGLALLFTLLLSVSAATAEPLLGPADAYKKVNGVNSGRFTTMPEEGWSAGVPELFSEDASNFLYLDLSSVSLLPEAGAVSVEVVRDELFPQSETLFVFMDEFWNPIWGTNIAWARESDRAMIHYAGDGDALNNIPVWMPSVQRGRKIVFTVAWINNSIGFYVDGQKLSSPAQVYPDMMSRILSRARYLTIGAEYSSSISVVGATNHLNSTLKNFRVFDTAETNPDFVAPAAVARIIGEPTADGEIEVSWGASASSDAENYLVFRSENATVDFDGAYYYKTKSLSYVDSHVIPGIRYSYGVVAVDRFGNRSAPSDVVSVNAVSSGNGPAITQIILDPVNKPMRPGQTVAISVKGQPNSTAEVEIAGLGKRIPLSPVGKTGVYTGQLTIGSADVADTTAAYQVVGKLVDDYGTTQLAGPQLIVVGADVLNDTTAPAVADVSHDGMRVAGFSGKLVAGDVVTVAMEGEKQGFASFRLVGVSAPFAMSETEPGIYKGSYTVGWLDEGDSIAVEATLSDLAGNETSAVSSRTIAIDTRVRLAVTANNTLLPADSAARSRILVKATNANGDEVPDHELMLKLSTTDEYTGVVGGGKVQDKFASKTDEDDIEVKWGGKTDSFGEVAATYTAGFAAKTALIVAKDLTSGDIGVGWLNTFVASTVAIQLTPANARDSATQPVIRMTVTPGWLTADGRSKARVRAWITEPNGTPISGARMKFELAADNGTIRTLKSITDSSGMAEADYRAGTVSGMVTIIASVPDERVTSSIQLELRSDAPAKIGLVSSAVSLPADGRSTSSLRAVVTDIHNNPNKQVPIFFSMVDGSGSVRADEPLTDDSGVITATFTAGRTPGTTVVMAKHTSRAPTDDELRRIYGTVFVPRLKEGLERDRIKVEEWYARPGEEVVKGQPIVKISIRDESWTLLAPEKGILARQVRHKSDSVELGDTVGYVEIDPTVWTNEYGQ